MPVNLVLIMELVLDCTLTRLRLGFIRFTSNDDLPERYYSIPLCLHYTKDGFIPHLTYDLSVHIPDNQVPIMVSLDAVHDLLPVLKSCDSSLSNFISNDFKRSIFLINQDVLLTRRQGFNSSKFLPIWTESGRINIYPKDLTGFVTIIKPDAYQLLADGETPKDTSNKRLDKSIQNTIQLSKSNFIVKGIDCYNKPVFGSIEGGWDLQKRLSSIEKTKSLPVDGYIIDGLLANDLLDDSVETATELKSLLTSICSALPSDKPRALFGPLSPEKVIDAITAGIDIIDSSYCSYLTDTEMALTIDMKPENLFKSTSNRIKLSDDTFKDDFTVIDCYCKCYTCTKGFTRAYLNHLTKTKEMLGPVLINLHNLYVYYNFINCIHSHFISLQQSDQYLDQKL